MNNEETTTQFPTITRAELLAHGYNVEPEGENVCLPGAYGIIYAISEVDSAQPLPYSYVYSPRQRTGVLVAKDPQKLLLSLLARNDSIDHEPYQADEEKAA